MPSKTLKVYTQGKIGNPVLLFLHAFPFSADMWKEQLNLFSEKFYCVAPDLPGFGVSVLPEHAVTFEHYVDSVLGYLTDSKFEPAVWCGLSMGGYLALRMYERAPERCRALILCDTKAGADGNEAKVKRWGAIQTLQKNRTEFVESQWQALVGESSKKNGTLKKRFEDLISKVSDEGIASGLVALATRTDSTPVLSKIRVPVLLVVGEEDKVTPASESELMAKAITGGQMKVLAKTGHLSNLENPQAEAIFNCYRKVQNRLPQLSDLKEILREHPIQEMRKYADILYSWTGETAFGRMLDGQSNVKLSKDLVTIEVKGLDNYRELKDIFLLLLTSYIKDEAASDLSRPYLLIVDEAQRLFKGSPMGREFAIDSFRVFRKYNAGIWCISQNYKDFLSDPDLADSLMPNTTFVFILRQRKIDWEDFKKTFDFNDAQVEAIKSLEIVKGRYSEFFLMQDEDQAVLRLEPEPLSYWICTTDGNEKARIEEARRANPERSLIDVLSEISQRGSH